MAKPAKLISPPGYGPVVPLDRHRHAGLGFVTEPDYRWAASLNAVFINAAEFFKAALDYPIAFAREPGSGEYLPMAILGLKSRQNLYVDAHGRWREHVYLPSYVRRYPFCIAELPAGPQRPQAQRLVCVDERGLTAESRKPLFDTNGASTPAWEPIHKLMEAMEGALQQTRVLAHRLEALDLLVPFDAMALPKKGERTRLQGLYRVDETRLADVQARDVRTLLRKGELRAVYAHLLSLENFGRLLDYSQTRK
ncbi:MAG TPA: SapC family protein [Solimonas sp.]